MPREHGSGQRRTLADSTLAMATSAVSGDMSRWTAGSAQQEASATRAVAETALHHIQACVGGGAMGSAAVAVAMASATVAAATEALEKIEAAASEGWDGE